VSANGAPHVLVVEDDEAIRTVIAEVLGDEGYRVTACQAPPPASADVAALAPAAVVLDVVIGGTRAGWAFLARLKADPATSPIPILVCTADEPFLREAADRLAAWECGVLRKPFDVDVLVAGVGRCVERLAPRLMPEGAASSDGTGHACEPAWTTSAAPPQVSPRHPTKGWVRSLADQERSRQR
jgi:CheY-like chemotaxis protein